MKIWRAPAVFKAPTSGSIGIRHRSANVTAEEAEESPIPAHQLGPIAQEMPFVLDFEERVKIFRALVKVEKRR